MKAEKIDFLNIYSKMDVEDVLQRCGLSKRQFLKSKARDLILINGKILNRVNRKLNGNETISLLIEDEDNDVSPEEIPLNIVFEDDHLLVVNKPSGMVVHQTKSHLTGTLANAISHYFSNNGIKRAIRFVNRLDMDTSGVVIVAKDAYTHSQMGIDLENNQVVKKYIAVTNGKLEKEGGLIEFPIGLMGEEPIKRQVTSDGIPAKTEYELMDSKGEYSLLKIRIYTGKTHQIRVHMSSIGNPIVGDELYGSKSNLINRQALHAYYVKFRHPVNGKIIEISVDLPEDFKKLIKELNLNLII